MQFEMSSDAKTLRNVLGEVLVGDTITYEELSRSIGRDVRVYAKSALETARKGLQKEKKMVFEVERGVGLVRLDDEKIVDSLERDRRKLQRGANRSLRKLEVVEFDKLSEPKKKAHIVASAQLGVISMFTKTASAKRIESAIKGNATPAIGDTLKMFGG